MALHHAFLALGIAVEMAVLFAAIATESPTPQLFRGETPKIFISL
jgi:hypothetical protein